MKAIKRQQIEVCRLAEFAYSSILYTESGLPICKKINNIK